MPNWKTYESSVRLLSAIVAAHPGLKLNYDEITKCYDSGMKSHTLYAHVWGKVKPMTKAISEARERGDNPMDIPLTAGLQEGGPEKG